MNFKSIPFLFYLLISSFYFLLGQAINSDINSRLNLLVRDSSLFQQLEISDSSFLVYDTLGSNHQSILLNNRQIEHLKYLSHCNYSSKTYYDTIISKLIPTLNQQTIPALFDSSKPLAGIRIALDPGHLAYDLKMAKIEGKYIEIKSPKSTFYEGNLTLCTSRILKNRLSDLGAQVLITRDSPKYIKGDFYEWYNKRSYSSIDSLLKVQSINEVEHQHLYKVRKRNSVLSKKILFNKIYRHMDHDIRANIINEFNPHLSLIIHYNVDSENKYWTKPTLKNFNMVFVPGSFMEHELDETNQQIEFIRLLYSNDLQQSIQFSSCISESLRDSLHVPLATSDDAQYLSEYCKPTSYNGVFARNLALTRKVHGVVCYGESLFQDNTDECVDLGRKNLSVGELKCNNRVKQVANAYYYGIIEYIKQARQNHE